MKITDIVVFIGVCVLVFFSGWAVKGKLYPERIETVKTDTLFVDKPYVVEKIKTVEKPVRYTEYITVTDTIETVEVRQDTVYITVPTQTYAYSTKFLTNFPDAPKLLGITAQDGDVSVTGLTPQGVTQKNTWTVGQNGYKVAPNGQGFVDLQVTESQKPLFTHGVTAGWWQTTTNGSPFLEYRAEFSIFTGQVTLKQNNPAVAVGVSYDF